MEGVMLILPKVALFQVCGRGHFHDDALPNFEKDSKSLVFWLSTMVEWVMK